MASSSDTTTRHLKSLSLGHKPISEDIRERLSKAGLPFGANDNICSVLKSGDIEAIEQEVQEKAEALLRALVIDTDEDPHSKETAKRLARMFMRETFRGRYAKSPTVTAFPNKRPQLQPYLTGPIEIRSTCAHHLQPIRGRCYIGLLPGDKVIGLSKFNRLVDWVASRPQIQEELTEQIADVIESESGALGVAVKLTAEHLCMTHRGVRSHEGLLSSLAFRGRFVAEPALKNVFFALLGTQEG